MPDTLHSILLIAVVSLVTAGLRFLPFWLFRKNQNLPGLLQYLGQVLPFAIMGMLVVYCLKGVQLTAFPYGLPELLGCAAVALLHIWKRNTLLSIGGGTALYMLLLRFVF